jgi:predicted nucleic acid-binding protein
LVVDADVWVSAADPTDSRSASSRVFLQAVMRLRQRVVIPALAQLEVACALSRRLRSAARGLSLAQRLHQSQLITSLDLDPLLADALELGTRSLLRAADSLYVAAARSTDGLLISWDKELIHRAGAITPEDWLAASR